MEHPWVRIPHLANILGLVLVALGVIVASRSIQDYWFNLILLFIGTVALISFSLLLFIFLSLAIRDYNKLKPSFTNKFLGIPY